MMRLHLPASAPQDEAALAAAEWQASRRFLEAQFGALVGRHSPETIITFQVLADHAQQAAQHAKAERLAMARQWLAAIDLIMLPAHPEIEEGRALAIQPVWALIHWRSDDHAMAISCLERALAAARILAEQFGHAYLTTKRVHFAANIARVLNSAGVHDAARALVLGLRRVIGGDAGGWPYPGGASLDVPLGDADREIIGRQLGRTESLLGKAAVATAAAAA